MLPTGVLEAIRNSAAVAVVRGVGDANVLAEAVEVLADEGFPVIELTLDSPAALDNITMLAHRFKNRAWIGAGTVRSVDEFRGARAAGAAFTVSPGFDPKIASEALSADMPHVPGTFTGSEVQAAVRAGCTMVKLFPSGPVGPAYLRALRGPFSDVAFLPTGGIDRGNAAAFLQAGATALGFGGTLTKHLDDPDRLREEARTLRIVLDEAQGQTRSA